MNNHDDVLLKVVDLDVCYGAQHDSFMRKKNVLKAVNHVSFQLKSGETLGVVGESGCGKSTLARAVLRLVPASNGQIIWKGKDLITLNRKQLRDTRQEMQIIFQDPFASLNPRMTVANIIREPLMVFSKQQSRQDREPRVLAVMQQVGLSPELINRYPHELSGGQCQRVGIARALILGPALIVCDEPVSALDVSIQAQIVNLLKTLQAQRMLALIFIAHDLSIVRYISDWVMVMYLGSVVEYAHVETLYQHPKHPYTKALLAAIPVPDPAIERNKKPPPIHGDLPSPLNLPSGCAFRTRCPLATAKCARLTPQLRTLPNGSQAACHYA